MTTVGFNRHFNGYVVEESDQYELTNLGQKDDLHVLGIYVFPDLHDRTEKKIIVMKNKVLFDE